MKALFKEAGMALAIFFLIAALSCAFLFGELTHGNERDKEIVIPAFLILILVTAIISSVAWINIGASHPAKQDNPISGMDVGANYEIIHQFSRDGNNYIVALDLGDSNIRTFLVQDLLPEDAKIFRYRSDATLEVIQPAPAEIPK